ncbi:MAG: Abortive infection protein, partial [Anaerolineales bacterium]|nr:Abortive infection protein [Anaerolineales bacterium]
MYKERKPDIFASIPFFFLTFALAWALWVPVGVFAPDYLLLASLPGVWAPTASALLLTGLTDGKAGLRQFIARLFKWRVGIQWYAVVLFGVAAIAYIAIGLHVILGGAVPPITLPPGVPQEAWLVALPLIFLINIFVGGPLAEDVGWRGYALPKLRAHTNALNASLIIGVIWVLWHLPFFLFPQTASVVGGI